MNRQTKQKTLVILKTTRNFSVIIVVFMNVEYLFMPRFDLFN